MGSDPITKAIGRLLDPVVIGEQAIQILAIEVTIFEPGAKIHAALKPPFQTKVIERLTLRRRIGHQTQSVGLVQQQETQQA